MDFELDRFMDGRESKSVEEKRMLVREMADILDLEELTEVIEYMRTPYFMHRLKDYMLDVSLPASDSPEFKFLLLAEKYNGNIARKKMVSKKISKYSQQKFIEKYNLREITSGYYIFPNKAIDGAFLFQLQYTKAVISHDTALYFHGLNDVIPKTTIMSLPETYKIEQIHSEKTVENSLRKTRLISSKNFGYSESYNEKVNVVNDFVLPRIRKDGKAVIVVYKENDPIIAIRNNGINRNQIIEKETMYHNPVNVTSMERSIVDVLKSLSTTEEEVKETALVRYFELKTANMNRLRRIAKEQNVREILEDYLWKLRLH